MKRLEELRELRDAAQQHFAEYRVDCVVEAPAQVGDITPATGWAYQGKDMMVTSIELARMGFKPNWRWHAHGKIMKHDGTPGHNSGEATWLIEEG